MGFSSPIEVYSTCTLIEYMIIFCTWDMDHNNVELIYVFRSPICAGGAGLSGGAVAAVVIIVILVLVGAGFAYWWLKVRPVSRK